MDGGDNQLEKRKGMNTLDGENKHLKRKKRSEEVQKASKSRGAWSTNPIPVKEIKHEGFGGNLIQNGNGQKVQWYDPCMQDGTCSMIKCMELKRKRRKFIGQ